jgi:hypothetical protein
MDTIKSVSSLTAFEMGSVRLSPSVPRSSFSSYVIPPPPINSQFAYRSSLTFFNIDWTRVRPYQKRR